MMKPTLTSAAFVLAATSLISPAALAQDAAPKWTVGALGLVYDSPFGAEDTKLMPVPYIAYRGERFYLEGLEAGYHLVPGHDGADLSLTVDLIAAARMRAGSSRDKVTADGGARLALSGTFGSLEFKALTDVTDTHNGQELSATYSYRHEAGDWTFTPSVGVVWQSRKLADYMWGVTTAEHDKMVADDKKVVLPVYAVGESVVNFTGGLMSTYAINDRWTAIGFLNGTYLDKAVRANPGITKDYELTVGLGVGYSF